MERNKERKDILTLPCEEIVLVFVELGLNFTFEHFVRAFARLLFIN